MSIKIESNTSITIDGDDYKTLSDICEVARILLSKRGNDYHFLSGLRDGDENGRCRMEALMMRIFDRE